MKNIGIYSKEFDKLCSRSFNRKERIKNTVSKIISDVANYGDTAVLQYTRKFDRVSIKPRNIRVTESEISAAFQNISPAFVSHIKQSIVNITKFHQQQILKSFRIKTEDGVILGEEVQALEKVGVYIPGGSAPLVSTVLMTVLPAKVAQVRDVYLASPPQSDGFINPYIIVVASLLKVKAIFKAGGAQAVAALALGTKTIPKVDKIVGPGNNYVTEAKRQLYGYVDIDTLAGPSEVVVIASKFTKPEYVIHDLKAQAEHKDGIAVLVTPSKEIANYAKEKVSGGYLIKVNNLDQAVDVANRIAPEHLELLVQRPHRFVKKIKNAGAIFLGPYSPTAVGDYIAGPSHVLPTYGTARFFSGLSVRDFLKTQSVINYSKKALEKYYPTLELLANIEGLSEHLNSVKVRLT
ncbi:MAG: histidinol dehydrogenase [Candidatus Omnitrophica bacterium]|nr:histidinol dehydrogenase [Candidatus Omnitrophota bacterium]